MNVLDENEIRDQLRLAVDVIDPVAPPLSEIEQRAGRRKRTSRIAIGVGAVALAGAGALVAALIVAVLPGAKEAIAPAAVPSHRSLVDFAVGHGAIKSR